jgi:hypothetical protein
MAAALSAFSEVQKLFVEERDKIMYKSFKHGHFNNSIILKEGIKMLKHCILSSIYHYFV